MIPMERLDDPPLTRWVWLDWTPRARRFVLGGFVAVSTLLLMAPAEVVRDVHDLFAHRDKLVHFVLFAVLAGLVRWSVPARFSWEPVRASLLLGAMVGYGMAVELVQGILPGLGRSFEWWDLVADVAGVVVGWCVGRLALVPAAGERLA